MTKHSQNTQEMREARTQVPASFVINNITPHEVNLMSKLGYFFAGVLAGATALAAAAFLIDDSANTREDASDSDDFDDFNAESDEVENESNDCAGEPEAAGKTVNPAT